MPSGQSASRRVTPGPRERAAHQREAFAVCRQLSIGGAYPWWSLGIFFLCVYIIHGLFIYGFDEGAAVN